MTPLPSIAKEPGRSRHNKQLVSKAPRQKGGESRGSQKKESKEEGSEKEGSEEEKEITRICGARKRSKGYLEMTAGELISYSRHFFFRL